MTTSDRTAVSTFDRVAIDLTHEPFPQLAAAILSRTDRILKHWRHLSLKAMPHLDALTLEEFENTIEEILSAVADAVQSANPQQLYGVIERGPHHGIDRFVQKQSLLDLFEEVRILRGVVIVEIAHQSESEEQYRTLFDLGPVAIYSCDAAGVIQTCNRRAVELWGREPALGDTDERFCGSFKLFRPDGTFMPHEQCPMAEVLSGKIAEMRDAEVCISGPTARGLWSF